MKILQGTYYKNTMLQKRYDCKKYIPLLDAPFKISHMCCNVMKKSTIKKLT
jgi:hypothetical protein